MSFSQQTVAKLMFKINRFVPLKEAEEPMWGMDRLRKTLQDA